MEGVPFVGDDVRAYNLLLKGRPLIMRYQQLRIVSFKGRTGREALRYFSIRQAHAANQLLKTGIGVKLIEHRINFQVDQVLVMFLVGLL
jgi:hypothetical protein